MAVRMSSIVASFRPGIVPNGARSESRILSLTQYSSMGYKKGHTFQSSSYCVRSVRLFSHEDKKMRDLHQRKQAIGEELRYLSTLQAKASTAMESRGDQTKEDVDHYILLNSEIMTYQAKLQLLSDMIDEISNSKGADRGELASLEKDINKELETVVKELEPVRQRLLVPPSHAAGAYVQVSSGAGGDDAMDWCAMLLDMYEKWARREGYKTETVDLSPTSTGVRHGIIQISSPAYALVRLEQGAHRLVRMSPFDSKGKRHTSFATVVVFPTQRDAEKASSTYYWTSNDEIRIETMRSSGPGGQHVNTTDSCVRITHLASGESVQIQGRSQHQNKERALRLLDAKLRKQEETRQQEERRSQVSQVSRQQWGAQIRNYVLHPSQMVVDVRSRHTSHQADDVLSGNLTPFLLSALEAEIS